jgi:hypothetical protein
MTSLSAQHVPSPDAIALLSADHAEATELFARYRSLAQAGASADERRSLAEEICTALLVHAAIEEEILYPAARAAIARGSLVDEALVEHDMAKALIAQVQDGDPAQPAYDARLHVLAEYVRHHVGEEEETLFPLLLESALDLDGLGRRLAARQEELLSANAAA